MPLVDDIFDQILKLDPDQKNAFWSKILLLDPISGLPRHRTGIELTPGVCGGNARIIRTRIPVWTLEQMKRLGASEAEILRAYPTLRAEDLVNAWSYVDLHRAEIDTQILDNEKA